MHFFYTLLVVFIHSIWQAFALLLTYNLFCVFAKNVHPLIKRNLLISLIFIQIAFSVVYFLLPLTPSSHLQNFAAYLTFIKPYVSPIMFCYALIVVYKIILVNFMWHHKLNKYATNFLKPKVQHKLFATLKAAEFGINKKIQLWYSNNIQVPITFGFLKPIILLPIGLVANLSDKDVEAIILHELTHIKHNDYLINWIIIVVDILYFFNPFIKMLVQQLWLEREKNCDVQVLNFKYEALPYAQVLLKIAQYKNTVQPLELAAVNNNQNLLKRVQYFLNIENTILKNYNIKWLIISITIIGLIPYFFNIKQDIFVKQMYPTPILAKNIILANVLFDDVKNTIHPLPNKKLPAATNKIKKVKYKTKIIENETLKLLTNNKTILNNVNNLYKQVSFVEAQIDSIKNVEYFEENAKGSVRKFYQMYKIKGEWILVPKLMVIDKIIDTPIQIKTAIDSLQYH